tara:strand:+ start:10555 stop:11460 length:906 start_codon:yes stop_codon:yes gene_type:complete
MKQGGQTSNFKFITEDESMYFVKSWDEGTYNPHSLLFQEAMLDLDIPLKVNKIISKDNDKREATFKFIKEEPWNFDISKAQIVGESMAKIHNWAATSNKVKSLKIPEKKNLYNNMDGWLKLDMGEIGDGLHELKITHRMYRESMFNTLKSEGIKLGINENQPKIATHRDFKKHNILSDGKDLYLIDFDFTATEYVSLEIMAFLTDSIVKRNNSVDLFFGKNEKERAQVILAFLIEYKKHSKLDIKWDSVLYDYLFYLISNTFPYYIKGLKKEDVKAMANWRTIMAKYLFDNREKLIKLLTI